jgi:hypothetical protein
VVLPYVQLPHSAATGYAVRSLAQALTAASAEAVGSCISPAFNTVSLCCHLTPQVMFCAPATSRQQALELAKNAPALRVRPRVVARWARFMTGTHAGQLRARALGIPQRQPNPAMLAFLDAQREDFIVPMEITRCAMHTTNVEQARILLDMFERERSGYAATRSGHADAPQQPGQHEDLVEWALPDNNDEGALHMRAG